MKRIAPILIGASIWLGTLAGAAQAAPGGYAVTATWHIGGDGGWDYATLSPDGARLYLPRTTHTQVLDTGTGKVLADIPGNKRAHGVALVPAVGRGFITDGANGTVQVFDIATNQVLGSVKAAEDADGILYDPASNRVLVMCGDANAMVALAPDVDPRGGAANAVVKLGGGPESAVVDGKGRAFIDLEDKAQVAVVDTRTMKVVAHWPTGTDGPVGMGISPDGKTIFVGCRSQKMVVMSTKDGKVLATLPIGKGVDAGGFAAGNAFASTGDGTLTVVHETAPGKFAVIATVKTAPGARTMAADPNSGKVYLPTAKLAPRVGKGRPKPIPGTFEVLVVSPTH